MLQECFARLRSACTPGPAFTPASCQRSSTEGSLLAALSSFHDAAGSSKAAAALPARPQPSRTTGSLAALVSEVGKNSKLPWWPGQWFTHRQRLLAASAHVKP